MMLLTAYPDEPTSGESAPEIALLLPAFVGCVGGFVVALAVAFLWTCLPLRSGSKHERRVEHGSRRARVASSPELVLAVPVAVGLAATSTALAGSMPVIPPRWVAWLWIMPISAGFAVVLWRGVRERLGVVWDVMNFWPRAFHNLRLRPTRQGRSLKSRDCCAIWSKLGRTSTLCAIAKAASWHTRLCCVLRSRSANT